MRALIQRVKKASIEVDGELVSTLEDGLLVYLGVGKNDTERDAVWLAEKIPVLRIFDDEDGKMNLSLIDKNYGLMVVSQFTLMADCRKGRRPSWNDAQSPELANSLYEYFINECKSRKIPTVKGVFGAHMKINYTNDGPVTIVIDSP